jgi:hypothetical protein
LTLDVFLRPRRAGPHPRRHRARRRAPRIYSVKFHTVGHRFCYIAARFCRWQDALTLVFSFHPFSVLPIRKSTCPHCLGLTYKNPSPCLAERQPATASSPLLFSCVFLTPDRLMPDSPTTRPISSSFDNARNQSTLPVNPCIHLFSLSTDFQNTLRPKSRSEHTQQRTNDDRLIPAPQVHFSSRPQTLGM